MTENPYDVLGVAKSATQDEIKNAYRNLAKKFHPDLNPGNKEAEKRFKSINGAYELVGTAEQRAKFDRGELDETAQTEAPEGARRRRGPFYHQTQRGGGRYSQQFSGMDEDFLNSIFSQMGRSGAEGFKRPGQDVLYQMEIDFKDAVLGVEREINLPDGKKLRVKIPPGMEPGNKLRFAGQGEEGVGNAPAGDAYVQLNVRPSSQFRRAGKDLEVELPISVAEAVLGAQVNVPTIEGTVLLTVPPGVSSGQKLRIPGKGIPSRQGGTRGDEIVVLKVTVPKEVDSEFRDAVRAWNTRQPFNPRENR